MASTFRAAKEIKDDWGNRERIDVITTNIKSLLSHLDSKLTNAEKHVDLLEAHVHRILSQQNHQRPMLTSPQHSSTPND
ncbi:unnamed protein product [Schistosoma margrebowiei]|uniref:Uncharacterized protein n=1 Tax=Schistosoma margrebowiei TaxID=48269 RepID=A0AA85A2S2_9TREM|nr:unnamed protein product [Schistosoma margrebowiei]